MMFTNSSRESIENRIGIQSFATSQAQCKDGKFSFEFGSEKYRPFEGAGCDGSTWAIALPSQMKRFDYMDITDVKLYISYTARSGKTAANVTGEWNAYESQWGNGSEGLVHEIQLSRDMPEWFNELKTGEATQYILTLDQIKSCLPYSTNASSVAVNAWLRGDPSVGSISLENKGKRTLFQSSPVPPSLLSGVGAVSQNVVVYTSSLDRTKPFELYIQVCYILGDN
jgi:hypothetical protein